MTVLLAAVLVAIAASTALVIRGILRGRRELRRLQADADQCQTLENLIAYHARRSQEIRKAIDELGDDAQHLFPPAINGR